MSDDEEFGYLSSDGEEGGEFFGDDDDADLLGDSGDGIETGASGDPGVGKDDKTRCSLCKSVVPEERMYTLDACGHRFCLFCISREIDDALKTSVTVCCPLKDCHTPLSVKDTMTLVKEAAGQRDALAFVTRAIERRDENEAAMGRGGASGGASKGAASKKATQRIAAELKTIQKGDPAKSGFSVDLVDDDLYLWEVRLFGFDPKDEQIARDMAARGIKDIVLRIRFPEDYPLSPPFCRVLRPHFEFHTGHVTLGGSICMELLTRKGWSPENSIEAVIMSIRSNFLEGGARLAANQYGDYSEAEAREAIDRLVRQHGWN